MKSCGAEETCRVGWLLSVGSSLWVTESNIYHCYFNLSIMETGKSVNTVTLTNHSFTAYLYGINYKWKSVLRFGVGAGICISDTRDLTIISFHWKTRGALLHIYIYTALYVLYTVWEGFLTAWRDIKHTHSVFCPPLHPPITHTEGLHTCSHTNLVQCSPVHWPSWVPQS